MLKTQLASTLVVSGSLFSAANSQHWPHTGGAAILGGFMFGLKRQIRCFDTTVLELSFWELGFFFFTSARL